MRRLVNVVLVRHGETIHNTERRLQGQSNIPLSANGRIQAKKVGIHLSGERFTRAYSSDLSRASETAELILDQGKSPRPPLVLDMLLRERGFGEMEGRHINSFAEEAKRQHVNIHNFVPKGAEELEAVRDRAKQFLMMLCNFDADEHILVVTHGGWLQLCLLYLSSTEAQKVFDVVNLTDIQSRAICKNTSVTRFQLQQDTSSPVRRITFSVVYDDAHLNSE